MQQQTLLEQLLFATVRIETHGSFGSGTGTSFVFLFEWSDKQGPFLVTNKHVVANAETGRLFFTMRDGDRPLIGQRFDIEVNEFHQRWHGHPDPDIDIAIMPLAPVLEEIEKAGKQIYFKSLQHTLIPSTDQLADLDAIEEVLFVGYPNGLYDETNLIPIARRGITATPLLIDYQGKPKFLLDASVFPGSSGSPVLLSSLGPYTNRQGGLIIGSQRFYFVGVIAQVLHRTEYGQIKFVPIPTQLVPIIETPQMIDLGIAYKSSTVIEAVQDLLKIHGEL